MFCVCHAFFVVTCWEMANILALLYVMFYCVLSLSIRCGTSLYRFLTIAFLFLPRCRDSLLSISQSLTLSCSFSKFLYVLFIFIRHKFCRIICIQKQFIVDHTSHVVYINESHNMDPWGAPHFISALDESAPETSSYEKND